MTEVERVDGLFKVTYKVYNGYVHLYTDSEAFPIYSKEELENKEDRITWTNITSEAVEDIGPCKFVINLNAHDQCIWAIDCLNYLVYYDEIHRAWEGLSRKAETVLRKLHEQFSEIPYSEEDQKEYDQFMLDNLFRLQKISDMDSFRSSAPCLYAEELVVLDKLPSPEWADEAEYKKIIKEYLHEQVLKETV